MPERAVKRPRSQLENRQILNQYAALFIPLILTGVIGYAVYVVVVLVGANHLLRAHNGGGAAVIAIFMILLLPMAISYFRIMHVIITSPGYTTRGPHLAELKDVFVAEPPPGIDWSCGKPAKSPPKEPPGEKQVPAQIPSALQGPDVEKQADPAQQGQFISTLDTDAIFRGDVAPPAGMDDLYSRDMFQCDPNGMPRWCAVCRNWKPDRSHHCSDVGRCVWKLDHFCPWVGGVVGENNFKFFILFNIYGALFTFFAMVVMAVEISAVRKAGHGVDVNWVAGIALAALFFFFTAGMAAESGRHLMANLTTVDAIDHTKRTVFLAIRLRDGQTQPRTTGGETPAVPWQGVIAYPFETKGHTPPPTRETFAIVCTPPGLNPWDLGPARNWRSVMGNSVVDWLLPFRRSPCCDHDSVDRRRRGMYELGPGYDQLLVDAGIGLRRSETVEGRHAAKECEPMRVETTASRPGSDSATVQMQ